MAAQSEQTSPLKPARDPAVHATRTGSQAWYWWIFPNLMLNVYEGVLDTNAVFPIGPDRCKVIFDFYFVDVGADQQALTQFLLVFFIPQVVLYGVGAIATAVLHARRSFVVPAMAPIGNTIVLVAFLVAFRVSAGPDPGLDLTTGELIEVPGEFGPSPQGVRPNSVQIATSVSSHIPLALMSCSSAVIALSTRFAFGRWACMSPWLSQLSLAPLSMISTQRTPRSSSRRAIRHWAPNDLRSPSAIP